jgi:hypothetical protein
MIEDSRGGMQMEEHSKSSCSFQSSPAELFSCSFSCSGGILHPRRDQWTDWSMLDHVTHLALQRMVVHREGKGIPAHQKGTHSDAGRGGDGRVGRLG